MFWFTKKPSSGSHSQYLAKIASLVRCRYRRRTDVVSVMAAYYGAIALNLNSSVISKKLGSNKVAVTKLPKPLDSFIKIYR